MNTKLFRLETGVLLDKEHPEYEAYNHVYTRNFGFFDENVTIFFNCEDAISHAISYIEDGVDKTYAIITSENFELTDEDRQQIEDEGVCEAINEFGFKEDDILYFAYQYNKKTKTIINKAM